MVPVPPWAWVVIGGLLLLLELANGAFVLAVLGVSAVATGGVALLLPPPTVTVPAFLAMAAFGLAVLRPLALRRFRSGEQRTNVEAVIGHTARLVSAFDEAHYGRVTVGGESWRAHLADGWVDRPWHAGARFTVLAASGVTLEVCPEDLDERMEDCAATAAQR